ncbi:LLM class F420-dependent oxidoreductase [Mycobacterium sp. NPDC003449]
MGCGGASGLRIDRGVPGDLRRVPAAAAALESRGYDGCWTGEINHDPFLPLLLAAEHTSRTEIGTSIAVAFARSPMTVAQLGWDLQGYSRGRFILGLGSQIRPHIEKRFGMPWSDPVRRMREYIEALHAIWECWQDGTELDFDGEFYRHTLMTPMFTPNAQPHGVPKVFVAAVGEAMTEMCGAVADGLLAHAFTTRRYLDEVTIPALERGLTTARRTRRDVAVSCPVFVVTGEDQAQMDSAAEPVRKQIAFYASTPAYRKVLELHGWGELQTELRSLSRRGEWDAMGGLIDDEILGAFAVVAPTETLAAALRGRCAGAIDRVLPSFPAAVAQSTVTAVLQDLRSCS